MHTMDMGRQLRMLLLEDSPADAELIEVALARDGTSLSVQRVDDRDSFARALRDFAPDVIISDHGLGQFDSREALTLAAASRPGTPVIVVTGAWELGPSAFVRAGAEGVVFKADLRPLAAMVHRALHVRERLHRLSPRQIEVLRMVADGQTTRDIANRLQLSVKTVETHRGEIMKRTGIHDVVRLVRYAIRVGLVGVEE
jgi:DNA-binding NarL/FixJ family response regulator